jgi:hypothetical protein
VSSSIDPRDIAVRCNPLALRDPCSKGGWYYSEAEAARELRHIQQYRKGPQSNYYPKRYYPCPLHKGVWHLTSREVHK